MNRVKDIQLISQFTPAMNGVFTLTDLLSLFAEKNINQLYRRLTFLEDNKILRRFIRGFYVTPVFDLQTLSQKICPLSYISFTTVLSEHLVIGTRPKFRIDALKTGKTQEYTDGQFTVRHFSCSKNAFFGFNQEGLRKASPEKAFLDTLYYYQHGMTFEYDIHSDINGSVLNLKLIHDYLRRYKNPRFKKFAQGMLDDLASRK